MTTVEKAWVAGIVLFVLGIPLLIYVFVGYMEDRRRERFRDTACHDELLIPGAWDDALRCAHTDHELIDRGAEWVCRCRTP